MTLPAFLGISRPSTGGGSVFPTLQSTTTSSGNSGLGSPKAVSMPATVNSGDKLLMLFMNSGTGTPTDPSGWTNRGTLTQSSNRVTLYERTADGSEAGGTVNITIAATPGFVALVWRITGYNGSAEFLTSQTSTNMPDPPSLSPSWGSAKTLWIAAFGKAGVTTVSVYPYASGNTYIASNIVNAASCWTQTETGTLNPGTFTTSGSGGWIAYTIGIRPV